MKVSQKALFFSVFTITMASIWAEAQTAADPIVITSVRLEGTGCEETTAAVSLSPDSQDLSVLFDNYSVEIGEGSSNPTLLRAQKNCNIFIDLHTPRDVQFAFKAVDYRGFVILPASAWAFHRFTYVSPNQQIVSMREASHQGASNQDYSVHFQQRAERMTWSPCGVQDQKIQLVSQLGVQFFPRSTDRSIAQISLDSADASFRQNFSIEWRKCNSLSSEATDSFFAADIPISREGDLRRPIGPIRPGRF